MLLVLGKPGEAGNPPTAFTEPNDVLVAPNGNIFVGEVDNGKRIQKFAYKGLGRVTARYQGTPWPASAR